MRPVIFALGLLALSASAAEVRVVGSDLLGAALARAVAAYARQNGTTVTLDLHGTRPGLEDLSAGKADVGLFMLPADEPMPLPAVMSRVIAYQVAVVVVPSASPLKQVTAAQLQGLFIRSTGQTFSRWGELGLFGVWQDRPIALRALAPAAGLAFPLFQRVILGNGEPKPALVLLPTDDDFLRSMAATESTIGITGAPAATPPGLTVLALAPSPTEPGFLPTPENVQNGDYPLRMPLYVVYHRAAAADLQPFLKFLLSEDVAAALADAHFVPLSVSARNQQVFELEEAK